jgi:hypothetical protein
MNFKNKYIFAAFLVAFYYNQIIDYTIRIFEMTLTYRLYVITRIF